MAKTKAMKQNKRSSNVKQLVKSIVNQSVEHKYFDQIIVLNAVQTGNIYNISDITRGDEVTQRIGNQVTLKQLDFRCSASINTNVDKAMVRFLLLVDKQGYNAPTVADVIEPANLGTPYTDILMYHWDYRRRFKILHDEVIPLNKNGSNGYSARHITLKLNLESMNIGASTTFTNQIYLIVLGSETNVLDLSTFQWMSRITFTDV